MNLRKVRSLRIGVVCAILAAFSAAADRPTQQPPRADAGNPRTVVIGETVTLDGAASTDANGDRLSYAWTLRGPAGSGARLSDASGVRPTFKVDLLGDYVAELVVHDAHSASTASTVRIRTGNVAPVADAGKPLAVAVGQSVELAAGASYDFNGDALAYRWAVVDAPAGSRALPGNARAVNTTFTPDLPGDYVLSLIVNDGRQDSAATTLRMSTYDAVPMADAGVDRRVVAGAPVRLDASRSADPDGGALTFAWALLHAPAGSAATLEGVTGAEALLRTDVPGIYVAQLIANDRLRAGAPDTVVVEALPRTAWTHGDLTRAGAADTDGDGIPDDIDNCAEHANPTQYDSNGDGFGNRCDADLDNYGFITNFGDLGLLRLAFFATPSSPNWNPDADFNEDDLINVVDLGIMKSFFFGPPGPIAITFINPAGGSWHDPANWLPPVVPNTTHTVRIDLAPGVEVEYSTGTSEIAGLRTSSPLLISGGNLSVAGTARFDDTLTLRDGATLENAEILPPVAVPAPAITIPPSTTATLDGVTSGADIVVETSSTLTIANGLTLGGGTVSIESNNNSFTTLSFAGASGATSTLGGTGEVVFTGNSTVDSRARMIVGSSLHNLLIGSGITVRSGTVGGDIRHNVSNGSITIQGSVIAGLTGDAMTINGAPLIVEGSVQVSNDARAQLLFNGVGGTIAAGATLDVNAGELELFGDFTNNGTINITDSTLDLGNLVGDEWSNAGTITLTNAILQLGGTFVLADVGNMTGTATTVINGTFDNTGQTVDLVAVLPGAVEFGSGAVILGGTLNGAAVTIPPSQTVTFDGVTLGADLTVSTAATLTIANGLTLSGGTVSIESNNNSFTTLSFSGASGATSTLGGTGEVVFTGNSSVDSRARMIVSSSQHNLVIGSGITVRSGTVGGDVRHNANNGSITIQGSVIAGLTGDAMTINGAPLIVEGSVQVSNDARAQLSFNGVGGTIAAGATLDVNTGELELFGDFTNNGTITVTDSTLDLGNLVGDEWSNAGSIALTNATLQLGGTFDLADVGTMTGTATTAINGTFDNTGQTVDLAAALPGNVEFGNGAVVLGGTLNGAALTIPPSQIVSFDAVTLGADVTVSTGATLTITNGLTLSGATVSIDSNNNSFTTLSFTGAVGATSILGGTGEVAFTGTSTVDSRARIIVGSSVHNLTIGPGITVRSTTMGGDIRHNANNGNVTIQGTVNSLTGQTVSMSGSPLVLEGTFHAGAGSVLAPAVYTLASSALVRIDVGGTATSDFGRVTGTTANLDGTLDLQLVNGFSPSLAETFQIMTFSTRNGTFATETGTALGGGLSFQVNYNAGDVTLEVVN